MILEREGQAAKLAVMFCEPPLIAIVAEHVCGPVPRGGGFPGVLAVISHTLPAGEIKVTSCSAIPPPGMFPPPSSVNGPTLVGNGWLHGAGPNPAAWHTAELACVTVAGEVNVVPSALARVAVSRAPAYGTPFTSLTWPVTVVACA